MNYHENSMAEQLNVKIVHCEIQLNLHMCSISDADRVEVCFLFIFLALINAVLYWQVAAALSRRTTIKKKPNHKTASLSKNSRCLLEIFVINNIANARRGVRVRHVMNFKSEK